MNPLQAISISNAAVPAMPSFAASTLAVAGKM
jgi:hypothetical protein